MANPRSLIPEVKDEDIDWVCSVMNLCDLDEPRLVFLRSRATLDVAACPGSGKTTLVVAKLAIMARKWPHSTKGLCVLSHTNAAREEIRRRLSGTVAGQQLLAYPHFIDTIHGFVNRFLALPWLNSHGFLSPTVDDDLTTAYRCRAIGSDYRKVQYFLEKHYSGFDKLRLRDREFQIGLGQKDFPVGPNTPMYTMAKRAVEASSKAGFFCYDEMFVWAKALLDDCPAVATWLQCRFPLVVIDEMQDTSPLQVGILDSVFPRTCSAVALQRVGDPNQRIYDNDSIDTQTADGYPDSVKCLKIAKSFRFGPQIAKLASPFAVEAVGPEGLQGAGPRMVGDAPARCSNAVFIFPRTSTKGVLDAYGLHVLSCFSDRALAKGDVTAIGAVHHEANDVTADHKHYPKSVPHYWSGYTAEIARREPHPRRLVQYFRVAQAVVRDGRDLTSGVEKIASGLVRLAREAGGVEQLGRGAITHRTIIDALRANAEAAKAYHSILRAFLINQETLTRTIWDSWQADILAVTSGLTNSAILSLARNEFVTWAEVAPSLTAQAATTAQDVGPNVYRVGDGIGRHVDIRLGSVHSVKGQTHLATMLLSTHWHDHSSKQMLPWLLGQKSNLNGAKSRDCARLLQTYVAMTRPSHLVCLAVPQSVLGDEDVLPRNVATLKERGWRVASLVDGKAKWWQ